MQLPENIELALQEKIIDIIEAAQSVSRRLWIFFAVVAIVAIPLTFTLGFVFSNMISNSYSPPPITYDFPAGEDLRLIDEGIVKAGDSRYGAYARLANPNTDLGLRKFVYEFKIFGMENLELDTYKAESYILPGQEKVLFFPAKEFSDVPVSAQISWEEPRWAKVKDMAPLNFIFENLEYGPEGNLFTVSAVLRNESPYVIPEIEITSLLFNADREVVGVNFTTVNTVLPRETRFFRHLWPGGLSDEVEIVDLRASVNQLKRGSFYTQGTDISEQFEGRE